MNKSRYEISLNSLFTVVLIVLVAFSAYNLKPWHKNYITSDGFGYYGYLPATFIHNDLQFGFIETVLDSDGKRIINADFRREVENGVVNICYVGTSILWAPFFLASHAYALISHYEPNGYTYPYQLGILLAGIFYLLLGLWALGKVLNKFNISRLVVFLTQITIIFATPALYYSVVEPSFSHIYSFTLINLFVLTLLHFFNRFRLRYIAIAAILAALIGLIRPTNGLLLIFLLPVFIPSDFSFANLFNWLKEKFILRLSIPAILFFLVISIQPIVYFIQTGAFFVWSYQGASFNFCEPQLINILFSYKKGLFVYTPILLFALPGLYILLKELPRKAIFIFILLLLNTYVLSSWWSWWFGMSLGHRAFIDLYLIWFIPLAYGVERFGRVYKTVFVMSLIAFGLYFQLLTRQYKDYVLYWDMDKDKFWRVFLQTSRPYYGLFWEDEKMDLRIRNLYQEYPHNISSINFDYEKDKNHKYVRIGQAQSGFASMVIPPGETVIFLDSLTIKNEINDVFLLTKGSFYIEQNRRSEPVKFSLTITRDNKVIYYNEKNLYESSSFIYQWNRLSILAQVNDTLLPNDCIIVKVNNQQKRSINFDDFEINIRLKDVQE